MPARSQASHASHEGRLAARWLDDGTTAGAGYEPRDVALWCCGGTPRDGHRVRGHLELARWLARLRGDRFVGLRSPQALQPQAGSATYWVPTGTVVAPSADWGFDGVDDLFGGVVPHDFVGTKLVVHPLVEPDARAPAGWVESLGAALRYVVLPGHAVFSREDAQRAGGLLLHDGPVWMKPAHARGRLGPARIGDRAALQARLDAIDDASFERGWVIERDLSDLRIYSVGQARVAGLVISYVGTQERSHNRQGEDVYGGSRLHIVRGDYERLAAEPLDDAAQLALQQAREFDRRVKAAYPGSFATRASCEIAQGFDLDGHWHSGVLEPSWHVDGATGAELIAIEAMLEDPSLERVDARTVEVHGHVAELPPGAVLLYRDEDREVGWLTQYAVRVADEEDDELHDDALPHD